MSGPGCVFTFSESGKINRRMFRFPGHPIGGAIVLRTRLGSKHSYRFNVQLKPNFQGAVESLDLDGTCDTTFVCVPRA